MASLIFGVISSDWDCGVESGALAALGRCGFGAGDCEAGVASEWRGLLSVALFAGEILASLAVALVTAGAGC